MGKISTILWDVDGTLLNFLYSQRAALAKCFAAVGMEAGEDILTRYNQINDSYWKRLELGEVTKEELLTGRFTDLFEAFDIHGLDVKEFAAAYQDNLGQVYCLTDGACEVCGSLRGRVKQYVVTNGVTATQNSKLKLSGLYDLMDGIFISESIGVPKPQKGFFDYCLAHVEEKDKSRILIVGDSMSSDIKGGVMAGILTCYYCAGESKDLVSPQKDYPYQPDYVVESLYEVPALL